MRRADFAPLTCLRAHARLLLILSPVTPQTCGVHDGCAAQAVTTVGSDKPILSNTAGMEACALSCMSLYPCACHVRARSCRLGVGYDFGFHVGYGFVIGLPPDGSDELSSQVLSRGTPRPMLAPTRSPRWNPSH